VTPSEHLGPAASSIPLLNTASAPASIVTAARPKQNWVLDPFQDALFIIAAPLLSLGLALLAIQRYGVERGAGMVILAHVILTVAHHLPTFIRIYGDVDLFKRFKWSFVLGPVIPLLFSIGVLGYLNYHHYPVEYFLYLYIFLTLWDPWHFLRQHFGFMRIYDRHNAAPHALASNMDWWICTLWFLHIMVASVDWIPGLLEDMYRNAHIPAIMWLSASAIDSAQAFTWWAAVLMTLAYVGYLLWCVQQRYYVSWAKIALLVITFGVMYLTYTPNNLILQLAPGWGFKVGFASVGIVHMTQYLAIVWRYDQRIAQQGRAREGWFAWLHARRTRAGIMLAAAIYVLLCVSYGNVVTTARDNRWLMSMMLAIGFISTSMHYYYDGFIWKVRHQQNRAALNMESGDGALGATATPVSSWWSAASEMTAGRMLSRQLLYFGIPLGILTLGALSVLQGDKSSYVQHMNQAQQLSQQGKASAAAEAARHAYARMQAELPFVAKLAELKPSSSHEAELAFLLYNESLYENVVMPQLAGMQPTQAQMQQHHHHVAQASELLMSAVYRGGDVAHPGHEALTSDQAAAVALSWQHQVQ